jgi:hypothetical protein
VILCQDCGNSIELSTSRQIKIASHGWDLPRRCDECKHDSLLIKGAIGALRDQFNFSLDVEIEKRGILFTDKVAVVRSRKHGTKVAEVRMDEKGLFFTERVAIATDIKSGKTLSETRDETRGILFPERVARTYDPKTEKRTHETSNETQGYFFPHQVAKTENIKTGAVTETKMEKKGFWFTNWIMRSDRKK